jgi:hypothetical protein
MNGNIEYIDTEKTIEPFWCWTRRCRRNRERERERQRAIEAAAARAREAAAARAREEEAARAEAARQRECRVQGYANCYERDRAENLCIHYGYTSCAHKRYVEEAERERQRQCRAQGYTNCAERDRAENLCKSYGYTSCAHKRSAEEAAERERIRKIKEEEERKRLAEERRIQALRNEKHNKHWNTIGKNEKRVFECDDINGNRLGGRNLYMDDNGIIVANEKSIILNAEQMNELNKSRKLSDGLSNPSWKKHNLSSGKARNFLYPYDPSNGKGEKIEYGGNSLVSNNYVFKLEMTKEGNLVLKKTITGCTDNYTKLENVGDYKAFKTDSSMLMNKYMLIDSAKQVVRIVADNVLETDNTFNYVGDYIPEDMSNMILIKDIQNSFDKCRQDATCDHIYYIESQTGDNYYITKTGMPDKYIPIQPDSNIKTSKLYIKNKKMKPVKRGENLPESESYILDKYNQTLPNLSVQRVSNYTAYSDYDVDTTPITQAQDFLGSRVSELKLNQKTLFEGFKEKNERRENEPIKTFIETQQIQPLEKIEDEYTKKLVRINDNYNQIEADVKQITNNDNTGLRDKLTNEKIYKKSYLEFELEKSPNVSEVRLQDTKDLINHNKTVVDLGIVTACTLLVASIVIARN